MPCFISQKQNVGKPSFPASTLTLKVLDQGSAVHISASIKWRERNTETGEFIIVAAVCLEHREVKNGVGWSIIPGTRRFLQL